MKKQQIKAIAKKIEQLKKLTYDLITSLENILYEIESDTSYRKIR